MGHKVFVAYDPSAPFAFAQGRRCAGTSPFADSAKGRGAPL